MAALCVVARAGGQDEDRRVSASVEEVAPPSESTPTEEPPPIEVQVSGPKRAPAPMSGGDFQLRVGQLRDVPRRNAEQLLTLAPGVFLSNHGGEGHPSAIFLRGFDAGEAQDIEMLVDGVPLNEPSNAHGHGYADTHLLISALVHDVRVVEGPFDPRQGDFAVAGSVEYELALPERGYVTRYTRGSFGRNEWLLLYGPHGQNSRTFAGAELVSGSGFGPNRAHRAMRAMGQYSFDIDSNTELRTLVSAYATRYDSAGVLREDDVEARRVPGCGTDEDSQFFCTYDGNQGGAAQRFMASVRWAQRQSKSRTDQQVFALRRSARIRENFTGYGQDPALGGGPQRGDGVEQKYDTTTVGARGSYARFFDLGGRRHELEVGYFGRHDWGKTRLRRLRAQDGVPYATQFDARLAVSNLASYVAGRARPLPWLVTRGGLRVDGFVFGVEDQNQPSVDRAGEREPSSSIEAFGFAFQPRGSVQAYLVPWLAWTVGAGAGTRSSDAQALSDGEAAPFARVLALETGPVAQHREGSHELDLRLLGFATRVDRDLVFDEVATRNVPIGESLRFGAQAYARMLERRLGVDSALSVTYAEAYVPGGSVDFLDPTAGNRLPYVPRWVARADTSLRRPVVIANTRFEYGVAAGLSYVDSLPLPLNRLGRPYASADVATRLRYRAAELGLAVTNLFDRRNRVAIFNYASNFAEPDAPASELPAAHFAAGPPREVQLSLTLYLDPEAPPR